MSSESLKILVVSFYFPPFNRVGGRRWAKHAKYFNKLNLPFYVLAGQYDGNSPWDADIAAFKTNTFRVRAGEVKKPFYQTKLPKGNLEKIKWKFSYYQRMLIKNFLRGNYNDISRNSERVYFEGARKIIEQKDINTVILSTGPFYYSKFLIELKALFPKLKIVIDYRDYWEDGFEGLRKRQIHYEEKTQQGVVNCVDLILSPNKEMQEYYAKTYNKPSYLLPHCIDEDDLQMLPKKISSNTIQLVYGGAFYDKITENIDLIKKFINKLNEILPAKADFYVSVKGYEKELNHPSINRFDFIESRLYFEKVVQADFVILILPPNRVNAMSSKFFELIALRKPILYFGSEGEVSSYIKKNKLGFHVTNSNLDETVKLCLTNISFQTVPDLNYDIYEHTFEHQTKKLIEQLKLL